MQQTEQKTIENDDDVQIITTEPKPKPKQTRKTKVQKQAEQKEAENNEQVSIELPPYASHLSSLFPSLYVLCSLFWSRGISASFTNLAPELSKRESRYGFTFQQLRHIVSSNN